MHGICSSKLDLSVIFFFSTGKKPEISYEPLNAVLYFGFCIKSLVFIALVGGGSRSNSCFAAVFLAAAQLFYSKDKDHFPMRLFADVVYVKTPVTKKKKIIKFFCVPLV